MLCRVKNGWYIYMFWSPGNCKGFSAESWELIVLMFLKRTPCAFRCTSVVGRGFREESAASTAIILTEEVAEVSSLFYREMALLSSRQKTIAAQCWLDLFLYICFRSIYIIRWGCAEWFNFIGRVPVRTSFALVWQVTRTFPLHGFQRARGARHVTLRKCSYHRPDSALGSLLDQKFGMGKNLGYYYGTVFYANMTRQRRNIRLFRPWGMLLTTEHFQKDLCGLLERTQPRINLSAEYGRLEESFVPTSKSVMSGSCFKKFVYWLKHWTS